MATRPVLMAQTKLEEVCRKDGVSLPDSNRLPSCSVYLNTHLTVKPNGHKL